MRVKLALNGDAGQPFVREDQINDWQEHVNVTQASEILGRYFLQPDALVDVPIAEVLDNLPFRLNYSQEHVKDTTLIPYELALSRHHDTHGAESAVSCQLSR